MSKQKYLDYWLLVFRIAIAAFMMNHGYSKLTRLMDGDFGFANPIGVGETASLILVVFSEFFCSIFIGIGALTRLASIPLIITMAVAAFITHGGDPFAKKEMALLYLMIYITILILGPGKYSVDWARTRMKADDGVKG